MKRGLFVVLEGPEGAGKTTLASALAARLEQLGANPVMVREPGGTAVAETLRRELLDSDREWTPERELLYVVTARADVVARVIEPALEAGRLVVSDRFDLSTRAYQGAGRGVPAVHLEWVNHAATGGLRPDLLVILDLDPSAGAARLRDTGRALNRLDRESQAFHDRVHARYQAEQGAGVMHLDGRRPTPELLGPVIAAIHDLRPDLVPA